jgi:hypothetical protein
MKKRGGKRNKRNQEIELFVYRKREKRDDIGRGDLINLIGLKMCALYK